MKKVFQTIVDPEEGNCYPACLASILELELDQVPHFRKLYGNEEGMNKSREWLEKNFGLSILTVNVDSRKPYQAMRPFTVGTLILVSGNSHSFPGVPHVVVGRIINEANDYELVHDPNPSSKGINGDPYYYYFFVAVDPARYNPITRQGISNG